MTLSDGVEVVKSVDELRKATIRLSKASREVMRMAHKRAETERDYRMALSKEIITLRHEGVQATLIADLSRGNVAQLKYERDLSMELHRSAMSSIGALQVEIQSWQSILKYMSEVE